MKLITWNSAMRFRDKLVTILPLKPDILVIPECEAKEKWKDPTKLQPINQFLWFGENKNKGIGIFTLSDKFHLQLHPLYNKDFRFIVPLIVTGMEDFILFAVWTQNTPKKSESYIGQLYLALKYYESLLKAPCIIAGDWNSNKLFDYMKRIGTHSDVVEYLQDANIYSAYHQYYEEKHGQESWPTYYFRKEVGRPFHLDFVFASECILKRLRSLEIGRYEEWIKSSDHLPIATIFDFS
jgi:exonuclease III